MNGNEKNREKYCLVDETSLVVFDVGNLDDVVMVTARSTVVVRFSDVSQLFCVAKTTMGNLFFLNPASQSY